MGMRVTLTCRREDGKPFKKTLEGGCLACMGRYDGRMADIAVGLEGAQPVLLRFHTVMLGLVPKDKQTEDTLARLWKSIPALRTCLSTPAQILQDREALFDVANYSLNEVMVGMFFLRQMLYYGANSVRYVLGSGDGSAVEYMNTLMNEHGYTWEQAYVLISAPTSLCSEWDRGLSIDSLNKNGGDGATYAHAYVPKEVMKAVTKGEYEGWNYDPRTYAELLAEGEGYPHTILAQTADFDDEAGKSDSMYQVYRKMKAEYLAMKRRSGRQETDLFGNPVGEKQTIAATPAEVFAKFKEIITDEMGDM